MLKSKKNRDSALLIFMALVTIIFLLYIFFPSGEKKPDKGDNIRNKKNSDLQSTPDINVEGSETIFSEIRSLLKTYFMEISTGDRSLLLIPDEELEGHLLSKVKGEQLKIIEKSLKFRFRDLGQALDSFKYLNYSDKEKFDLYISLFLIRIKREGIIERAENYSSDEAVKILDLDPYTFIGNEVDENYRSIPIIIFSEILIKRTDIFSPGNDIKIFLMKLSPISDISSMQYVNSLKDILNISSEERKFSFGWVEKDPFDPDDKGIYKNVNIIRRGFFNQKYINFPGVQSSNAMVWIRDLLRADSGTIELKSLKITDETPGENYSARSIVYSETTSRFTIIMDSPSVVTENGIIALMINEKMRRLKNENTIINFSEKLYSKKDFEKKLIKFGKFLSGIKSVF